MELIVKINLQCRIKDRYGEGFNSLDSIKTGLETELRDLLEYGDMEKLDIDLSLEE